MGNSIKDLFDSQLENEIQYHVPEVQDTDCRKKSFSPHVLCIGGNCNLLFGEYQVTVCFKGGEVEGAGITVLPKCGYGLLGS